MSEKQPPIPLEQIGNESTAVTAERPRVLVSVVHRKNRELLVSHLRRDYEVESGDALSSLETDRPDLLFVCEKTLQNHHDDIRALKATSDGFLPCLLVIDAATSAADVLVDDAVDDLIRKPLDTRELDTRIQNLLVRRQQSVELQDRRKTLHALADGAINAIPDVFYVFDRDGRMLRWNDRLEAVTGIDTETIAGSSPRSFVASEDRDRVESAIDRVLDGAVVTTEAKLLGADGEQIPYELVGAPMRRRDGDIQGVVGIGRDISGRRERSKLRRQNERLEQFAGIAAHDIRNPLGVAKGYLELARDEGDTEELRRVAEAHDRIETLVGELLSLAAAGDVIGQEESIDLDEFVDDCWSNVETGATTIEIAGELPTIQAAPGQLRELLENLFRNAVEHGSDSDGPDTDLSIRVGQLETGGFYVEDTGSGIDPAIREEVLERGMTTTRNGTGFGLAIVEEIATAHGWSVAVTESAEGGARFEFSIPE
ncbi:MAG: PAS domain-containing sensor histidine kinase [Natronomonas sp.]